MKCFKKVSMQKLVKLKYCIENIHIYFRTPF